MSTRQKFLKFWCLFLILGVGVTAGRGFAKDNLKVGYVNLEKVFQGYYKTDDSRKEFDKEKSDQQQTIAKQQESPKETSGRLRKAEGYT